MSKNRKHLTPEEVQEFKEMGVDLGENQDVYLHQQDSGWWKPITNDKGFIYEAKEHYSINDIIPAPNLQEVLEVLPKQFKTMGRQYVLWIDPFFGAIGYKKILCPDTNEDLYVEQEVGGEVQFEYTNLLIGAADLLRWVCKNHPETLKTK